ncbi:MAG: V-type ATPase subunit [Oscillospiraceae bacterium]|nr:V-type ATPase subunit [Oscillospiraceae bacterium]
MSFSFNSVIAKARAVYGKALTPEDYAVLCSRTSVAEAAAFLKQTPRYEKALSAINPQTVHRGQLEALLTRSIFEVFERFHSFDFSESRAFFRYIIMELEAEQLLTAIEGIGAGSAERYIAELPVFLTRHAQTDLIALGKARSYLDIAELLSGTSYDKILRPLLIDAQENGNICIRECERRLYTAYYMSALKSAEKIYRGKQRDELKRALLKSVDMENVVTCLRMRAFGADKGEMKELLLPFKYRLNDEQTEYLMQLDSAAKVEAHLEKLGYRTDAPAQFDTVEQLTEKITMHHLRRMIRLSQNSAAVYYALIECLKIEQRNVKTAIEGIRYGLSSSEILDMLVI